MKTTTQIIDGVEWTHESYTVAEATARLTARWHDQCLFYPSMRNTIPLALYLERNVPFCVKEGRWIGPVTHDTTLDR
jgi:hypothetical protein